MSLAAAPSSTSSSRLVPPPLGPSVSPGLTDDDFLEADDLPDRLEFDDDENDGEKEPGGLDPLVQALQLPELSRGLETASDFFSWGWAKTVASVESIKENQHVKNALASTSQAVDNITASEQFKSASSGLQSTRKSIEDTFENTIAPTIHDAMSKVKAAVVGPSPQEGSGQAAPPSPRP